MNVTTIHIRAFDSRDPACGATGITQCEDEWTKADSDPRFRRCKRCEKKLGPGGVERLRELRDYLATLRAAETAGRNDANAKRPSRAAEYRAGSLEAQNYERGYDAARQPKAPPKQTRIRTVTPGYAAFVATLDAARAQAPRYSDTERQSITRAITRANDRIANQPGK